MLFSVVITDQHTYSRRTIVPRCAHDIRPVPKNPEVLRWSSKARWDVRQLGESLKGEIWRLPALKDG